MLTRKDGKAFEMKDGAKVLPDALELLPSHLVQFKLGKQRFSDSLVKYGLSEYKITEISRGYNPDPENPYYGQSIISAAASAIDSGQQMQSWNRRTFSNNARLAWCSTSKARKSTRLSTTGSSSRWTSCTPLTERSSRSWWRTVTSSRTC